MPLFSHQLCKAAGPVLNSCCTSDKKQKQKEKNPDQHFFFCFPSLASNLSSPSRETLPNPMQEKNEVKTTIKACSYRLSPPTVRCCHSSSRSLTFKAATLKLPLPRLVRVCRYRFTIPGLQSPVRNSLTLRRSSVSHYLDINPSLYGRAVVNHRLFPSDGGDQLLRWLEQKQADDHKEMERSNME